MTPEEIKSLPASQTETERMNAAISNCLAITRELNQRLERERSTRLAYRSELLGNRMSAPMEVE